MGYWFGVGIESRPREEQRRQLALLRVTGQSRLAAARLLFQKALDFRPERIPKAPAPALGLLPLSSPQGFLLIVIQNYPLSLLLE